MMFEHGLEENSESTTRCCYTLSYLSQHKTMCNAFCQHEACNKMSSRPCFSTVRSQDKCRHISLPDTKIIIMITQTDCIILIMLELTNVNESKPIDSLDLLIHF